MDDLTTAIRSTIDNAEQGAGINTAAGNTAGETNAGLNETTGRLEFQNGADSGVSNFNIDFTVLNANGDIQTTTGITRQETIAGAASGAQAGNAVTAFTGSTFNTGQITMEISNVREANNRVVESQIAFETGTGAAADANTNLIGSVFNGATLAQGDTIQINGANADGSTFTSTVTISTLDTGAGDGAATTMQDLIDELNARDQTQAAGGIGGQGGFTDATAALTEDGRIQLTDDLAGASQSNFTLTVNDRSTGGGDFGTITDSGTTVQAGNAETATVRLNGGPAQIAEAGEMVTLYGEDNNDGETSEITFRMGTNLTNGTDTINNTREEFTGSLNNGPEVQFGAGQQNVQFESGIRPGEMLTLDFDAIVDVPLEGVNDYGTVMISAAGEQANFQIGANAGDTLGINFGDARPSALGLGEGRSLNDIDVTQEGGVDEALQIVDEALNQVGSIRQEIGAFTNRLELETDNLAVAAENLLASRSRITDVDVARQSTIQANAEILLKSNLSVQSQINNLRGNLFVDLLR